MSRVQRAEVSHQAAPAKKRKKKKSSKGLWIIVLILAILVGFGGYYTMGLRPVEPGSEEEVVVEIPSGSGASMIVEILDGAGLVRNKFCAKVNSRIGMYHDLQANTYIFNKGMSFPAIMKAIDGGDFDITSAEGIEATQVEINGGTINIEATDDGINGSEKSTAVSVSVAINGGEINISMGQGDTDAVDVNGDLSITGGTLNITAQSPFDVDGNVNFTGGTVIENGQEVSQITNQMMGGGMMGHFNGGQMGGMPGSNQNGQQQMPGQNSQGGPGGQPPQGGPGGQAPSGNSGSQPDFSGQPSQQG
jgi:hypothetical protein